MSNQFHRLLTQQELHRPELSGVGDPNEITRITTDEGSFEIPPKASQNVSTSDFIFNPEDGLYYQDVSTGDIYRYTKYESIPLSESQGYLIGTVDGVISAGQDVESIFLENPDAGPSSRVAFFEGQVVSLQTISGDFEKLVVAKGGEVATTSFELEVQPFTARFDIGGDNAASVLASNGDGQWERIIAYDRANQSIKNTSLNQRSGSIGTLSQGFGGEEVVTNTTPETFIYRDKVNNRTFDTLNEALDSTGLDRTVAVVLGLVETIRVPARVEKVTRQRAFSSIRANLRGQLFEGQEITILNEETGDFIFLTLETQEGNSTRKYGPGENILIDVQDDRTDKVFPAGSLIYSEAGFLESTLKVDPSRIQQGVREVRAADGIGVVQDEVFKQPLTVLNLNRVDEPIDLKDNQPLIIVNDDGLTRNVRVDGDQSLSDTGNKSLTIQELNPMAQQEAIATIDEDLTIGNEYLEIAVTSPVSGIEIRQHEILNLVNQGGQFREVSALVDQVITEETNVIQVKDASSGGVNPVKFEVGDTEFFAGQSFIKFDPPRFDYEEFTLKEPSYVSTSRINVTQDQVVLKVDTNGNLAKVSLIGDADFDGSAVNIKANQINLSGQVNFFNGLKDNGFTDEGDVVSIARDEADSAKSNAIFNARNDVARELGYGNYFIMQNEVQQKGTVINGGLINTGLINADAIFSRTIRILNPGSIQSAIYYNDMDVSIGGFRIDANGNADFQNIHVRGNSRIGDGSEGRDDVTIEGKITLIGENGLRSSRDALDGGSGVVVDSTGFFAGEAGQTKLNANVRINASDGSFVFGNEAAGSFIKFDQSTSNLNIFTEQTTVNELLTVRSDDASSGIEMRNNDDDLNFQIFSSAGFFTFLRTSGESAFFDSRVMILRADPFPSGDLSEITMFPTSGIANAPVGITLNPRILINADTNSDSSITSFSGALYVGGDIRIDATTSTSATAGANGALPTDVEGYMIVNINDTNYKIPYYNT